MTAYSVVSTVSGAGLGYMAVTPVSYEIKIPQIQFTGSWYDGVSNTQSVFTATVSYGTGITTTGGASVTPTPLRQGAVAATATAKTGITSVSSLGNNTADYANVGGSVSFNYQPPFDFIVHPGSVLIVSFLSSLAPSGGIVLDMACSVFFEELRLSWPY